MPRTTTPSQWLHDEREERKVATGGETSRFLALPVELRLPIYEFVFRSQPGEWAPSRHALAILLTCKQVYDEANQLAFSLTNFFVSPHCLKKFGRHIDGLSPARTTSIRHLAVESVVSTSFSNKARCLPELTLDTLTFIPRYHYWMPYLDRSAWPDRYANALDELLDTVSTLR